LEETNIGTDRKLRLFAVACCRHVERWFVDPCQSRALNILECYADGLATRDELDEVDNVANQIDEGHPALRGGHESEDHAAREAAYSAARAVAQATSNDAPGEGLPTYYHRLYDTIMHTVEAAGDGAVALDRVNGRVLPTQAEERKAIAALLRCIFGNPFRPVAFNPAWRTSDVLLLAQGIYDERAFDRMPILADALQDAGCDNDDILSHCRDANQPHARGCWVVDLVLGKT